jgi:signal transduction histidine kinase
MKNRQKVPRSNSRKKRGGVPLLARRVLLLTSSLLLLLLLWALAGSWYEAQLVERARTTAAADVTLRGNALAAVLNRRFSRLQALTAFVETLPAGAGVEARFAPFAARLFAETQGVRSFSLAPDGEVAYVYPRQGNESLLGEDLLREANGALLASGEIVVSDLLTLPGGEPGLVAYQAVHRDGRFWGLTGMSLDLTSLLADAELTAEGLLDYALRDAEGTIFFGDAADLGGTLVRHTVPVPEVSWELVGVPRDGWTAFVRPALLPFRLVSLVVVFLLVGLTYVTLGRQASLRDEVLARTRELALANAQLERRVVERTRELATLLEVARSFTATLALQPLLDLILRRLKQEPGYTMAALYIVDEAEPADEQEPEESATGDGAPALRLLRADGGGAPPPTWHPLSLVVAERHPLRRTGGDGHAAWLVVPLQVSERVTGVLALAHEQVNRYDEHGAALVLAVASHAAVALENARLYQHARELAVLQERQRLARELHDSVSQALYGVALGTRTARQWLQRDEPGQAAAALDYVQPLTEAALTEMRALIFELRPESLAREGLAAALERQAAALRARYRVELTVELCPEPEVPLPVKESLYRVAQEALNNVARHAGARHVWMTMSCDENRLVLAIRDDGRGFDAKRDYPGHLGLHSMRERIEELGGQFSIQSAPGQGTLVEAALALARWQITHQTAGNNR